jgi:hypothetical protein
MWEALAHIHAGTQACRRGEITDFYLNLGCRDPGASRCGSGAITREGQCFNKEVRKDHTYGLVYVCKGPAKYCI